MHFQGFLDLNQINLRKWNIRAAIAPRFGSPGIGFSLSFFRGRCRRSDPQAKKRLPGRKSEDELPFRNPTLLPKYFKAGNDEDYGGTVGDVIHPSSG